MPQFNNFAFLMKFEAFAFSLASLVMFSTVAKIHKLVELLIGPVGGCNAIPEAHHMATDEVSATRLCVSQIKIMPKVHIFQILYCIVYMQTIKV